MLTKNTKIMISFNAKKKVMKILTWSLFGTLLLLLSYCKKDEEVTPPDDPVASFQYVISSTNYLEVSFTNFSTPAEATYAWDFGDVTISTEKDPTHLYTEEGTYTVTLTTTNSAGSATFSESITITDPDKALKLLTGEVSKTWKLYREGTSMSLGPDAGNPGGWWPGLTNNGDRPCLYYQTFTFHLDGTFVFDDMDVFWGENDPFSTTPQHETCFVPDATTMVNLDGADVSAWGSGTHAFTYDASTGEVVLTGMGAWMGLVHTIGMPELYSNIPTATRTFNVSIVEETGYDLMTLTYEYGDDGLWTIVYVNYSDTNLEPDVVTENVDPPFCVDLDDITPSAMGHTFETTTSFDELGTFRGASTIEVGVDDPANSAATKVGKYSRVASEMYQEAQIRVSPDSMDFNLTNFTTVSLDVYFPSTNDYTGSLSKVVALGFADQSCVEQWWTDINQWVTDGTDAEDTWHTLTYQLNDVDAGNPKERAGLDMLFINIGSGGHTETGTFYVRNLIFQ